MARRRYRSDAISNAGRAQAPPAAATESQQPLEPKAEYGKAEPDQSPQHFSTGLKAQLDAQRAYAQPQDGLDAFINQHYSGALPHERQWLRDHPEHMQHVQLVHAAGMVALQRGIPRHSPEFLHAIEQLIAQHHAAMQAPPPPPMHAPPPPMPPPMQHHIELEAEHDDESRAWRIITPRPSVAAKAVTASSRQSCHPPKCGCRPRNARRHTLQKSMKPNTRNRS